MSIENVCRELQYKSLKITRNKQSSFRITFNKLNVYIDPFKIEEENHDADYIFISHEHPDHFDVESLQRVIKPSTILITNETVSKTILGDQIFSANNLIVLNPNDHLDLDQFISIDTRPAYNINKFRGPGVVYHPKNNKGLGFILNLAYNNDQVKIYHMGDTDFLDNEHTVEGVDILMIPVGGTYVMTPEEAIEANNHIKPLVSIPMHFGGSAGTIEDANLFVSKIGNQGEVI